MSKSSQEKPAEGREGARLRTLCDTPVGPLGKAAALGGKARAYADVPFLTSASGEASLM